MVGALLAGPAIDHYGRTLGPVAERFGTLAGLVSVIEVRLPGRS
jgi:hypothetical protein